MPFVKSLVNEASKLINNIFTAYPTIQEYTQQALIEYNNKHEEKFHYSFDEVVSQIWGKNYCSKNTN